MHKKQLKYDQAYMRMAFEWAKLSYCKRKQVGALIVKKRMIISDGFNGAPSGFENCCEDENGETKWYVLTPQEFKGLAGKLHSDVPDGDSISLARIKQKLDLVDGKASELAELKTLAESMANKIASIGM